MPRSAPDLTRIAAVEPNLIATRQQLDTACGRWRQCDAIGIDTEFVRERTFYPALGLIQVADGSAGADGNRCSLVDTVAIENLEPLGEVLVDPAVTKIFHSCGEDLEVLYHRFGEFPCKVFDTQVAAALTGLGYSVGYGRLVAALFGVELPKDKTRTDWLRRPLSEAQRVYAALDVAYLLPARSQLRDRLRDLGREDWVAEELEPLFDAGRFWPDPEQAYLRIGARRSLAPRQLAALQGLAAWREKQARRQDLPRNFVLREKTLVDVARRQPETREALAAIASLHRKELERHGETLLRLVRRARNLAAGALPEAPKRVLDLTPYREEVRKLRARVVELAEELSMPPELLASRKTIEKLLRRVVSRKQPPLPPELRGWRHAVVGEALLESLEKCERPR